MKKIDLMSAVGMIAMAALSCAKGYVDPSPEPVGETKKVRLTVDASTLSRVGHTDGEAVTLVWKTGDQVLVVDATDPETTAVFTLTGGENSDVGIFEGSIATGTNSVNVFYPATIATTPINYALQTQSGDGSMDHFANNDLMSATGVEITVDNTANAMMTHRGIIFTIPITNDTGEEQDIVGVTIADRKDYDEINFSGSVSLVNNTTLTDVKAASIDLIFANTLPDGGTATANVVAYLSDYAALADKTFDVFVHTKTGRYMTAKTGIAMAAGIRYTIENVEMNGENFQSDLFLLGDAFETSPTWATTGKVATTNNQDGTYTWSGPLFEGSSFRFSDIYGTEPNDWDVKHFEILDAGAGNPIAVNAHASDDNVPNFSVPGEGLYDVVVDFTTMQATVEKTAAHRFIYPVGGATLYRWTPANSVYLQNYEVVDGDEIVSDRLNLAANPISATTDNYIKFIRRKVFGDAIEHITPTDDNKPIVSGQVEDFIIQLNPPEATDYKWIVNSSSGYDIEINYTARTITFTAIQPDGLILPAYENRSF